MQARPVHILWLTNGNTISQNAAATLTHLAAGEVDPVSGDVLLILRLESPIERGAQDSAMSQNTAPHDRG